MNCVQHSTRPHQRDGPGGVRSSCPPDTEFIFSYKHSHSHRHRHRHILYIKTDYTTLFMSDLSVLLALSLIHFLNTVKKQYLALIFAYPCRPPYFSLSASRLMLSFKAHLTINTDHCIFLTTLTERYPKDFLRFPIFICFTFNVILQGPLNNKHRSLHALSYTLSASRLMLSFKAHLTINTDHCMRFPILYLLHV